MKFDKRRQHLLLFILTAICLCVMCWPWSGSAAVRDDSIIRFHVMANSDSDADQALKLQVRDAVLDVVNPVLSDADMTLEESNAYLHDHLSQIEAIAESAVKQAGFDYSCQAAIGIRWIPERTYGDVTYPAGNYKALTIVIGAGAGHNWWCVLFPPLCLIDPDFTESAAEAPMVTEATQPALVLKSKTVELFTGQSGSDVWQNAYEQIDDTTHGRQSPGIRSEKSEHESIKNI